jgi:hypothetical protein
MTVIRKTVLSDAAPQQIRDQTRDIASARLRDLAIQLAADPDLRVSVMTGQDGTQELEVLYTGPPHRTEDTIDGQVFTRQVFTRQAPAAPTRTLAITSPSGLQHAVNLIRATLLNASALLPQDNPDHPAE